MWSTDARKKEESDSEEESDEESEEESDDEAGPSNAAAQELSREDRKKEKKARKDAAIAKAKAAAVQVGDLPPSDGDSDDDDDDMPANPNHSKAARKQLEPVSVDEAAEAVSGLSIKQPQSRRERETLEAAQAQARYRKLHEEGKTDQAKADLERLAAIREKREADKARKEVRPHHWAFILIFADHSWFARPSARRERSRKRPSGPRLRLKRQRSGRRPSAREHRARSRARSQSRTLAS